MQLAALNYTVPLSRVERGMEWAHTARTLQCLAPAGMTVVCAEPEDKQHSVN